MPLCCCFFCFRRSPPKQLRGTGKCGDDVTWTVYDSGTLSIYGSGPMWDYGPDNPAPWKDLADESVFVENGVTHIGSYAFYKMKIKSVTIYSSVTSIGNLAFDSVSLLQTISIPESVTEIGNYAFADCPHMRSASIPGSVQKLGTGVFANCKRLERVRFDDGGTLLGKGTFMDCPNLKTVGIPASVTSVTETDRPFTAVNPLAEIFYGGTDEQWAGICGDLLDGIPASPAVQYQTPLQDIAIPRPQDSGNRGLNDVMNYAAEPVTSYLYADGDELVRVEMNPQRIGDELIVERFNSRFQLLSTRMLPVDTGGNAVWGGFFAGKQYNYVIAGYYNTEEDPEKEVIRVIQYDRDWNYRAQTSLYGRENITKPFDFGTLRCAEDDEYLYVYTCRIQFQSEDGLNHQTNYSFAVPQETMSEPVVSFAGHVSHAFSQHILVDQSGQIITADLGDVYPRGVVLQKSTWRPDSSGFSSTSALVQSFPKNPDVYQRTGAGLGGLAETSTGYLTAYCSDGAGGTGTSGEDIYLAYTAKDSFSDSGTVVRKIAGDGSIHMGTPMLVSTGLDGGYILWNSDREWSSVTSTPSVSYAAYDSQGTVSEIRKAPGVLSDCQPIVFQDSVVWYATESSMPVFYTLDEDGVQRHYAEMSDFFTKIKL